VVDDNLLDPEDRILGAHIRQQTEQYQVEESADKRTRARLFRTAEAAGIDVPSNPQNPARVLAAVEKSIARQKDGAGASGDTADKLFVLDDVPPPVATVAVFWHRWAQIKKAKPGTPETLRHALTRKTIGSNPLPREMTPDQLQKMVNLFDAILREARKPSTA
jgi:hypothetical protein